MICGGPIQNASSPGNNTYAEFARKLRKDYNASLEDFWEEIYAHVLPTSALDIIFIVICFVIFFVGLAGNFLVCYAVWKNPSLRSVTNYFLVNLAVGDFLVILLCLPLTVLHDVTKTWFLGDVSCKLFLYLQDTSVVVSVVTLTAIAIERWLAICHPLRFRKKASHARRLIACIWILALASTLPDLIFARVVYEDVIPMHISKLLARCEPCPRYDAFYRTALMIVYFLLPVVIMCVAYSRIVKCLWHSAKQGDQLTGCDSSALNARLKQRYRSAKMLVMVVIVFAICYIPVHTVILVGYWYKVPSDIVFKKVLYLTAHALVYINSTTNPIIYNFMSTKFREEFKRVCSCSPSFLMRNRR